jgi:hypothetical protein
LLDTDSDRTDLELWLIKLTPEGRPRVHPFAGNGRLWRKTDLQRAVASMWPKSKGEHSRSRSFFARDAQRRPHSENLNNLGRREKRRLVAKLRPPLRI